MICIACAIFSWYFNSHQTLKLNQIKCFSTTKCSLFNILANVKSFISTSSQHSTVICYTISVSVSNTKVKLTPMKGLFTQSCTYVFLSGERGPTRKLDTMLHVRYIVYLKGQSYRPDYSRRSNILYFV